MSPAKKELDLSTYKGRFGSRLKELRKAAGLSQVELAAALEISQNTVSQWETAISSPTVETFPVLAKALKLEKTKDLFPDE